LRGILLTILLGAVLGTTLLTAADALEIEAAADYMITNTRKVLDATTAY
jgi:hypothetical protein